LCRYVLRPPIAQDRLALTPDGQILLQLRTAWSDGTTHFLFEPLELLEKLAALIPRPRINLLIYHGILASHARGRRAASAYGRPGLEHRSDGETADAVTERIAPDAPPPGSSPHRWAARRDWAHLMQRAFDFDVLSCPRCGDRMRLIATIEHPAVVRKILTHLGLSTEVPTPLPARSPPTGSLFDDPA
jgi:hypothetical protein